MFELRPSSNCQSKRYPSKSGFWPRVSIWIDFGMWRSQSVARIVADLCPVDRKPLRVPLNNPAFQNNQVFDAAFAQSLCSRNCSGARIATYSDFCRWMLRCKIANTFSKTGIVHRDRMAALWKASLSPFMWIANIDDDDIASLPPFMSFRWRYLRNG